MSLLGTPVYANPTTPLWGGGGGGSGPTGPTGPTGGIGPTGPSGGGAGDIVIFQATENYSCPGGDVVTPIDFTPMLIQGSSISVVSSNVVQFTTPGLYKIMVNSGFANGEYGGNPITDAWALVRDEFGTGVLQGTSTIGSGFNGSATQVFIQPPVANWTAEFVMRSDIGLTYSAPFIHTLNAEITRIA